MFELVPSRYMRKYFQENGFEFSDSQKATLIWNMPGKTRDEILAALKGLADTTQDEVTRQQILERIRFEEKQFTVFKDNSEGKYVYVVEEYEEAWSCGFFAEYEMAFHYAVDYSKKNDVRCSIKKQLIVRNKEDEKVRNPFRSNPNLFPETEEFCDYDGQAVSAAELDKDGEIYYLGSSELSKEEEQKVDDFRKDRFEFQFIKIPFDMEKGSCVKNVLNGTYGILAEGKKEWDEYMQMMEDRNLKNLYADFSDVQVVVYQLTESGYWSHEHMNPMFLEMDFPPAKPDDKKRQIMRKALEAFSDYIRYKNEDKNEDKKEQAAALALNYTKAYAKVCKKKSDFEKRMDEAKAVEDILC